MSFAMRICAAMVLMGIFGVPAWAADVKLSEPQTEGGKGVFSVLKNRTSAASETFPTGKVSQEELSTLLWAASGLNRPEKGWTVPMAMGREPYCRIYVAADEGAFLYDWKEHALKEISADNVKGLVGAQPFVGKGSHVLIFVVGGKSLEAFRDTDVAANWGQVAAGAMTQNVYLAAEALDIGVRYIASLKADAVRSAFKLDEKDIPVCIMPIGKK